MPKATRYLKIHFQLQYWFYLFNCFHMFQTLAVKVTMNKNNKNNLLDVDQTVGPTQIFLLDW